MTSSVVGFVMPVAGRPCPNSLLVFALELSASSYADRIMKRTLRLRRPKQFQRVRREGRSYQRKFLILTVVANRRRNSRCGFVVGRRVGTAVVRNRARRRVREAVRLAFPLIRPGFDLVFVIRSGNATGVSFHELQALVETLLREAGLWNEPPAQSCSDPAAHLSEATVRRT